VHLLLLIIAAALASITSCSPGGGAVRPNTISVTDADNFHAVTLVTGDTLVVSLASTPGTGFGWKVAQIDDKVLRLKAPPESVHGVNPMPGAPTTQVFRFVAAGGGSTGLELEYVRPWEHSAKAARVFHLGVTVR
jgi:inhibitor of cysteine peptidase